MKTERYILDLDFPDGTFTEMSSSSLMASPKVAVWLVILDRCCIIWLGEVSQDAPMPDLAQLVVGMSSTTGPISTQLYSEKPDSSDEWHDLAESMARRIAHKFQIQAFVSEQLINCRKDMSLLGLVERLVVKKLRSHFPLPPK
jgi:hypothetical protein